MKKTVVLHLLFGSFIFNGSIAVNLFIRCSVILKVGTISWSHCLFCTYLLAGVGRRLFAYACIQNVFSFNFRNSYKSFLLLVSFLAFHAVFLKWSPYVSSLHGFRVLPTTKHNKETSWSASVSNAKFMSVVITFPLLNEKSELWRIALEITCPMPYKAIFLLEKIVQLHDNFGHALAAPTLTELIIVFAVSAFLYAREFFRQKRQA